MASILILDDDPVSALVIEGMLEKLGHQVKSAGCCADAWTELRTCEADILILDTDLGGETGWEFLEKVRQHVVFGKLPVIVCSGISRREVVQRYLVLGVQGMLIKPSTSERLAAELVKAGRTAWRDAALEPAAGFMEREGYSPEALAQSYRRSADEIWATMGQSSILAEEPFNAPAISRLLALKSCAINAKCPALDRVIKDVLKAYNRLDKPPIVRALECLPLFVRLLRQRADELAPPVAAAGVSVGDAAARAATGDTAPEHATQPEAGGELPDTAGWEARDSAGVGQG